MVELLWLDVAALVAGSVVAILDVDVQVARRKVGRPVYGLLVLLGLLGVYVTVVRQGTIPIPGYGVTLFAVLYLPFLSSSFIDLETTDRLAQQELERLLLDNDFPQLRHTSGHGVLREGRRRLRIHWESREAREGISVELDVHPSLMPLTVSRPHVASVRDQGHLERIRNDIRRRRAAHGEARTA